MKSLNLDTTMFIRTYDYIDQKYGFKPEQVQIFGKIIIRMEIIE